MKIEINLFATLARYKPADLGQNPWALICDEGATIQALFEQIGLPLQEVKLIFLNGVHAQADNVLHDGDRLGVFPPVGGG